MKISIKKETSVDTIPYETESGSFYSKISIYPAREHYGIEPVCNITASLLCKNKIVSQMKATSLKVIESTPNPLDNAAAYGCQDLIKVVMDVASDLDDIYTKSVKSVFSNEEDFFSDQIILIKSLKVRDKYWGFNFPKELMTSFLHNAAGNCSLVVMEIPKEEMPMQSIYWADIGFKPLILSNYLVLTTFSHPWLNKLESKKQKSYYKNDEPYPPLTLVRD